MFSRRKSEDHANYVFGAEAAKILGMCRVTFYNRIRRGGYDQIRRIRNRVGIKYLIHDVFQVAHPKASDKMIEKMVFNWRLKKAFDTKKAKRGRKK